MRGKKVYEPPQFMSVNTAVEQILEIIKDREGEDRKFLNEDTLCVGIARLGTDGQVIKSGQSIKINIYVCQTVFSKVNAALKAESNTICTHIFVGSKLKLRT